MMILKNLQLTNFRNLSQVNFKPGSHFNILWGNNGQGKTNLLEAIHYLGFLKSFRGVKNEELTTRGEDSTRLMALIKASAVEHRLSVNWSAQSRSTSIDGKYTPGTAGFLGMLPAILFAPEEISLVRSYPAGRRNLLDRAVFLTHKGFLDLAREYQRQLKQRNLLLKETRPEREIKPWTEGLIKNGARLRRARIDYLKRLTPWLEKAYSEICQERENISIHYPGENSAEQEELLCREFDEVTSRERRIGQTLAGPHRDDPHFVLNGEPLKTFGSQGQQRSFILALKCAQVLDFEEVYGKTPLLLLDDLTSELDPQRRNAFITFVQQRQGQAFLTTTDISPLMAMIEPSARIFQLKAGNVIEQ